MKRVLAVGLTYTGEKMEGVEIDTLGLCSANIDADRAAFPIYEYDTVIINPKSYSHFLFGTAGEFSNSPHELVDLKRLNNNFDIDNCFYSADRLREMAAAIGRGTTVIWCLAEPKQTSFFGRRDTHIGYLAPAVATLIRQSGLQIKKSRTIESIDPDSPFVRYFEILARTSWTVCLADQADGYTSIATSPENYSLGGHVLLGSTVGWLLTPPTSQEAENQLIRDSIAIGKADAKREKYHGVFLSHTGADKPFVRQLRTDLLAHGVPKVWIDEAEIQVGDSLLAKIDEGLKETRYIAVVLSNKSISAPWVKKELDIAMNREIAGNEVVVLPLLYEKCELPGYLQGKLYADFTSVAEYETSLAKVLRRLRIV